MAIAVIGGFLTSTTDFGCGTSAYTYVDALETKTTWIKHAGQNISK